MAKYQLINIGRNKVTRTVEVLTERQLLKEVRKHLMSREVDISFDDNGVGTVFAGMRSVGEVHVVGHSEQVSCGSLDGQGAENTSEARDRAEDGRVHHEPLLTRSEYQASPAGTGLPEMLARN